jgi:hypothetical protein
MTWRTRCKEQVKENKVKQIKRNKMDTYKRYTYGRTDTTEGGFHRTAHPGGNFNG